MMLISTKTTAAFSARTESAEGQQTFEACALETGFCAHIQNINSIDYIIIGKTGCTLQKVILFIPGDLLSVSYFTV
jgi:hypothetical protein